MTDRDTDWFEDYEKKNKQTLESIRLGWCGCQHCIEDRGETAYHMIVCKECGNKRCPHATNHQLACTQSNEPGQSGSSYE